MKMNPMNPEIMKAFMSGRKQGEKDALDKFHAFLTERMQSITDIKGIGEKTAWKVHQHFIEPE